VLLGCFIEGETAAISGGVIAHRGLLVLWQVTVAAAVGAFIADFVCFIIGRKFRHHPRVAALMARKGFAAALTRLDRHPTRFTALFRFIPGMRILGPVAVAQSQISALRFGLITAVSASLWSLLYTHLGRYIATAVIMVFGDLKQEHLLFLIPVAMLLGLAHLVRRARQTRSKA